MPFLLTSARQPIDPAETSDISFAFCSFAALYWPSVQFSSLSFGTNFAVIAYH